MAAASTGAAPVTLRVWRFDAQWWLGMLRTGVVVVLALAIADYLAPAVFDRPGIAAAVSFGVAVTLMTRGVLLLPSVQLEAAGLTTMDEGFVPWAEVTSFRLTRQGRLQLAVMGETEEVEVRLATRPQRLAELERMVHGYVVAAGATWRPATLRPAIIH